MKKRQIVPFILLMIIMVFGGAFLSIRTLNRENFRVKVGPDEITVIFEDGDYENLDRARLIWTVNNLFESVYDYEFAEYGNFRRYHLNGREVETNLYLHQLGRGKYRPDILRKIGYKNIVKVDGINHLVLSREFIEAFIEASSKYGGLTDELNNFIDRLNQIKSTEIDNMTEAQIDSMLYLGPRLMDRTGLEQKRRDLRGFTVDIHFQSTNVFWIIEVTEKDIYSGGDETKPMFGGNAICYKREDYLRNSYHRDRINPKAPPPSNFDPRLHTEPDAEPFIWVPVGTWEFINENGQWKLAIFMPGT